MTARVETTNPCRFFQNTTAVFWLCIDKFAYLILTYQSGRVRPGRGVSKQQLDIACTHLLAINPKGGPCGATDFTRYFKDRCSVEGSRGFAFAVVQNERYFGQISCRALVGACKDDVVHFPATQCPRRSRAHYPSQRFKNVGLAATIWTDNAG